MYHTVPDFSAFDTEWCMTAGDDRVLTATAGYGFAYITALLVVSVLIFARRDFKWRTGAAAQRGVGLALAAFAVAARCRSRSRLTARGAQNRAFP